MHISINELRSVIRSVIVEGLDPRSNYDEPREKDRIKRSASTTDWQTNNDDAFDDDVGELAKMPEYASVDAFVTLKLDNDEFTFTTSDLQALSLSIDRKKNGKRVEVASPTTVRNVKQELVNIGLKFVPREPVKFVRGSMSSAHGSHPFAGSGGGGGGFSSDRSGPGFTSYGGGPGAIGGGYEWRADDPRNLSMGSKRR